LGGSRVWAESDGAMIQMENKKGRNNIILFMCRTTPAAQKTRGRPFLCE
jgi:hypothetical protein